MVCVFLSEWPLKTNVLHLAYHLTLLFFAEQTLFTQITCLNAPCFSLSLKLYNHHSISSTAPYLTPWLWLWDSHLFLFIISFLSGQHNLSELQWKMTMFTLECQIAPGQQKSITLLSLVCDIKGFGDGFISLASLLEPTWDCNNRDGRACGNPTRIVLFFLVSFL